jgi:hypothetical protein
MSSNIEEKKASEMSSEEKTRLASELRFYALHKSEWLREQPGKYVVVKGNTVVGFYSAFESAFRAGVDKFGLGADFLVKQVMEHEPVFFMF